MKTTKFSFGLIRFYGTSIILGNLIPNSFFFIWTVLFQTIQFSISTQFCSIWPIDRIISGATTPGQNGPGSDGNEGVHSFGRVLPLCRDGVGVFHSPSKLGHTKLAQIKLNSLCIEDHIFILSLVPCVFNICTACDTAHFLGFARVFAWTCSSISTEFDDSLPDPFCLAEAALLYKSLVIYKNLFASWIFSKFSFVVLSDCVRAYTKT